MSAHDDPTAPAGPADPRLADLAAGLQVFLIALPLCLGIALASGFPPVAGILTAVVGGLVGRLPGASPLAIKGPAAGLIVIALESVAVLGEGDPDLGYRRTLAVGLVAAGLQLAAGGLGLARFAAILPGNVVHGMLAAIGVIIVAKQGHVLLGVRPEAESTLAQLAELPASLLAANPSVALIGAISFGLLLLWPRVREPLGLLRRLPSTVVVLAAAIPLALALGLDRPHTARLFGVEHAVGPEYLLALPASLVDALALPDFTAAATLPFWTFVGLFALIGSLESVLSVLAVDALDPERRTSDLDRDLRAVGAGNLLASAIGGLPMISEIVRSKANIDAGARSSRANLVHGLALLVFVAALPGLLRTIPLAALAAMLVLVGLRLAAPGQLLHAHRVGLDQSAVFATTLGVTLATDLLIGIAAGLALELALDLWREGGLRAPWRARVESRREGGTLHVRVEGPASFLALPRLEPALAAARDPDVRRVVLDLDGATSVAHAFLARVRGLTREWPTAELELRQPAGLRPLGDHPLASRRAPRA